MSRGSELRDAVLAALDLDVHECALLDEAARIADRLDALDAEIERAGTIVDGRPHPALVEARQQAITLARVIAALRLPEDLSEPGRRPQRRAGARGVYTNVRHKLTVV